MRLFSWNVNGIRATINKGAFQKFVADHKPDVLCLQETKAKRGQAEIDLPDYEEIWNSASRAGYSGTAVFTKVKPLGIIYDFPEDIQQRYMWADDQHGDPITEGRIITAEFEKFYLINVYTPNAKRELTRIPLRHDLWDPAMLEYIKQLEKHKPVVACGDFNVANEEIDLARPKARAKEARQEKMKFFHGPPLHSPTTCSII